MQMRARNTCRSGRWFVCVECLHKMRNSSWRCGRCGMIKGPLPLAVFLVRSVVYSIATLTLVAVSFALVFALLFL